MSIFRYIALLVVLISAVHPVCAKPLVVGSKNFTESLLLAEIVRLQAQQQHIEIQHRRALGGTRIVWRALENGDIDIYAEYTGTLLRELLPELPPNADLTAIGAALKSRGLGISAPLGFNDSYALGMTRVTAQKLGIERVSDLPKHPELRFGLSNEFLQRSDGWPALRDAYGLPQTPRGMDHDLAYRALKSDSIDVVDLYTSDAEIAYYDLRVLNDDRKYFPRYDAVLIYRLDALHREPALADVLRVLSARIDLAAMQRMNAAVKIATRTDTDVAAEFLGVGSDATADSGRATRILARTLEHLELVSVSLGLALLLGLPLGIFAARKPHFARAILSLTGILQTVPSLAMFVFMIPFFGIGAPTAIAALFLYSLLPIVRNTYAGLTGIAPDLRESAAALGLPSSTRLWRIELPLATRTILAGIKIAAVINVGTATLGALIGAGGYGETILTGIRLDNIGLILEGAIPAAVMALLVQELFEWIERRILPRAYDAGNTRVRA
jgi:osmoprotectant transport system permease protein